MKRYFAILILALTCIVSPARAQAVADSSLTARAEKAYEAGDFQRAVLLYQEVLGTGEHSAALYYNLGNAYFKSDMLGLAILNYSRALKLDPSMEDAKYNLDVAGARTVDKIDSVPEFFALTYIRDLRKMLDGNTWAVLSLIFLCVALGGIVAWLVMPRLGLRKVGFTVGVLGAALCVVSFVSSVAWWDDVQSSSRAVVINTAAPVQSSPAATGAKDLFVLHEGTTVEVLQKADSWCEIAIANGDKGWVNAGSIEII